MADFIREDGSTRQFIDYSTSTGQKIGEFAPFGASDAGCWSRGLAWAIGGFLRGWEETEHAPYLDAARRMLKYWDSHTDSDLVPLWDLSLHGRDSGPKDTSASAVVFEGLARLAVRKDKEIPSDLLDATHRMAEGL